MNQGDHTVKPDPGETHVLECEAVPLERVRSHRVPQQRTLNWYWLIPIVVIGFLLFKFMMIGIILVILLFSLPKLLPAVINRVTKSFTGAYEETRRNSRDK